MYVFFLKLCYIIWSNFLPSLVFLCYGLFQFFKDAASGGFFSKNISISEITYFYKFYWFGGDLKTYYLFRLNNFNPNRCTLSIFNYFNVGYYSVKIIKSGLPDHSMLIELILNNYYQTRIHIPSYVFGLNFQGIREM